VCVDKAHARFLGGRGAAMRPAYPTALYALACTLPTLAAVVLGIKKPADHEAALNKLRPRLW